MFAFMTHIVQAVAEADDISASVLAAVLHAAARLSAASGAQSSNRGTPGSTAGSSGFHAAQGARMQAFQRSLDWLQQQAHSTDSASSAVRLRSFSHPSSGKVCRLSDIMGPLH